MSSAHRASRRLVELPAPRVAGSLSVEEALAARRTTRRFANRHLSLTEVSQLAWAAQGTTSRSGGRTAPSAGALYPLELYLVLPDGMYRYLSRRHRAESVEASDFRPALGSAVLDQDAVGAAGASLVICGVFARTATLYERRANRYVWLEAGHAAQNVLLEAVALGLGAVAMGAFDDLRVCSTCSPSPTSIARCTWSPRASPSTDPGSGGAADQ